MDADAPVPRLVVSTDMLPERERFDAWREEFALKLARVDMTTPDRAAFYATIGMQPLDRLSLVTIDVAPVAIHRTAKLARDGNDDLALVICTRGTGEAHFGDRAISVATGVGTLVPQHMVGGFSTSTDTKTLTLRMPRALLRELLGDPDPPILPRIPASDPSLQLISAYAQGIAAAGSTLTASTAALAERHLCELIANMLDPTSDIVRSQRFGGIKAARLKAIVAGIERHLCDPDLSAEWLGAKLGLSERYVYLVMAEAGLGFSPLVRRKRLERARRLLEQRSANPRRVIDIAYAVGFSDLSSFNRAFRAQFGRTPSDVRRGG